MKINGTKYKGWELVKTGLSVRRNGYSEWDGRRLDPQYWRAFKGKRVIGASTYKEVMALIDSGFKGWEN